MIPYQQTAEGCRVEGAAHRELRVAHDRVGVQVRRRARFPWLRVARVPRFGRSLSGDAQDVIGALVDMALRERFSQVRVEVWNEDAIQRMGIAKALRAAGFRPSRSHRSYRHTIWIDLRASEEDLFAGFHATCRRHIRAPAKRGYLSASLTDHRFGHRLASLITQSFRRTGGRAPSVDWDDLLRQSGLPDAPVRIEGLFADGSDAPSGLVAFSVAYLHGDVAEYAHAGSDRTSDGVPLLYAPTWNLMRWARAAGARDWDFGGVPRGDNLRSLSGIKTFKRYFSRDVRPVGEEWELILRRPSDLLGLRHRLSPP
jgi:hypothetical protein